MRKNFDDELTRLLARFSEMGLMTTESMHNALQAFVNHDKALAKKVIDNDSQINQMEIDLERNCYRLIALQQPVTSDLRLIVSILKASSDLERMGDHADSLAESTNRIQDNHRIPEIEVLLQEMGQVVIKMAEKVIDAFTQQNSTVAKEIAEIDSDVDHYHYLISRQTLPLMQQQNELVENGNEYILISNNLERMGDYITNICERIVYMENGILVELN